MNRRLLRTDTTAAGVRAGALVLVGMFVLTPGRGLAEPATFPAGIAFNRGLYSRAALDAAVKQGVGEVASETTSRTVVRHLRVEVFENNREATAAQTTLFALCESTFHATLTTGRQLLQVRVRFVILDAFGKPAEANAWRVEFREELSKESGKLVWTKVLARDGDVAEFHRSLPEWAKRRLWVTSGFLSRNPGQPPVPFAPTLAQDIEGLLETLLDFAPGVAKTVVGKVIEKGLKKASAAGFRDAVKNDEARWGWAEDVTHEKVKKYTSTYEDAGRKMWVR
jgi:hypothetical protein